MKKTQITLRGGTALSALALLGAGVLFAAPAMAQDATVPVATPTPTPDTSDGDDIVVTGSLFSSTASAAPSPVTVVTAEALDRRGINTIQDAIQQLASNNGPALTNSFTANGAFAGGASGVSLRGLSTNSTLVLFDGLRASYYPLSDDGTRNFVDLNTIPDDIVERIEVLRDGASSTYGADAIAGVINIITKREFKGVGGRAEAGISERGDAAQYRLSLTAGIGDIDENGYNAYISGFYYKSDMLYNRDRPYPFNSDDLRNVCLDGECGPNNTINGLNGSTIIAPSTGGSLIVAPTNAANTGLLIPTTRDAAGNILTTTRYQDLGVGANCPGGGTRYALTAAQLDANPNSPAAVCQYDRTNLFGVIQPNVERFGVSARVTATVNDSTEAYFEANFMQSSLNYTGYPATLRGTANTGIFFPQFSTSTSAGAVAPGSAPLTLPVYVCPTGVPSANGLNTGCNASNGTLNPNNPFAAAGQTARLVGLINDRVTQNATRSRSYRGALGIQGALTDSINFNVGATAMHTDLRRMQGGYFYINNLLTAIARGTFNFVNPSLNTAAQWDFVQPDNVTDSTSDQYQLEASLNASLVELPGGPLRFGAGGSIRYEAVDAPSANSDVFGPTQRYFTLNAFGTKGDRTIKSAFAELDAPITNFATVNASGRYDSYSSGQDAFSPKVGVKLTPVRQLVVRGTYSRGFRIPSFGESNALPTTGFVTNSGSALGNTFLAQYTVPGNTAGPGGTFATCSVATFAGAACDPYVRGSYGQTTLASPNLKPEKSRSFTAGAVFEPTRGVTLTVDYYNIKKTGAITQPSNAPALSAYYANQPIPAGYTVIADAPSVNFPNARPRVAFVQSQLINANTIRSEGIDASIDLEFNITDGIKLRTSAEATYIIDLSTTYPDGSTESYEGTSGNYNLTAGSGTPEWHGSWLTTLDFGDFQLSGTVNYFGGYNLSAEDQTGAGTSGDCSLGAAYAPCDIKAYITGDLNARFRVNDKFSMYFTVLNVLDKMPPIEVATYGAHLYNPVQAGNGILGRYFRAGVTVGF